ncbi:gamma carbonic anhydrase family protein [Taylorella equigenitalis]|uniref:Transferase n=1 Tax=Taylorella equigenitalis ATCC 35865 TaxID=743973 RepID=A0ABM5N9P3_9BURK|nr:gamma carbonic anhydrase family protein [Taylorella equigenitalis]AFN35664.1 putative transferase [Taylorella equigenitalis ATCC 35865]ASY30313.1 gamma carbonic anhydrase family protein [Taylorella equigenitalis]ASY37617.1 gamma carbonic anhydrase family protein [Taylorella equigenitalis]ASY39086.1 gamma carbonic anhydrase family protein [Taylorella equigenitalis]ASY40605.1 gamma carbonic anhydrase family protein [Taylorella equigenitalis]
MPIYSLKDKKPKIHPSAFIFENAIIIGDVTIGPKSSVWPNTAIRGDVNKVVIGEGTNIQEGSVLHEASEYPLIIGDYVTIGHMAMVHACTIGNGCLIGMNSIILDGAVIGDNCIIAAGAIVTEGKQIPPNSLVVGVNQIKGDVSEELRDRFKQNTLNYVSLGQIYKTSLNRLSNDGSSSEISNNR